MGVRPTQQDKQSEVVQNQLLRSICELSKENEELLKTGISKDACIEILSNDFNEVTKELLALREENAELKQRIGRMEHNARCVLGEQEDEKIDDPVFVLLAMFTYSKELLSKVANAKNEKDAFDLCVLLRHFLGR